jgi:CRP/FNR family transcriptional regulator
MRQADSLSGSFLGALEPSLTDEIRRGGDLHHYSSGDSIVSEADGRWTGIVLSGLARVFLRTEAGRQVTLRQPRRGATIGIAALLGDTVVSAQAVTDCTILQLDTDQLVRLAATHPDLALAVAREVTAVLAETYHEAVVREQRSVRQRIAHHLLAFGRESGREDPLVVPVSHEELADSIGSAREVVTRHLDRLRAEGLVTLDRGRITVLDPAALDTAAA